MTHAAKSVMSVNNKMSRAVRHILYSSVAVDEDDDITFGAKKRLINSKWNRWNPFVVFFRFGYSISHTTKFLLMMILLLLLLLLLIFIDAIAKFTDVRLRWKFSFIFHLTSTSNYVLLYLLLNVMITIVYLMFCL